MAAHVYMDTFAHYGFSGIGSELNLVKGETCVPIGVKNLEMEKYVIGKKNGFFAKYAPFAVASWFAEEASASLGHGGVATFPDRPFLHWSVEFEKKRPGNGRLADRDNPTDYLEACEKTHSYFSQFARKRYASSSPIDFSEIKAEIDNIVRFEGAKEDRSSKWKKLISDKNIYKFHDYEAKILYDPQLWETEKTVFKELGASEQGIETNVYKFHQAASWHRHFVLKELLPAHKIAVY